MQGLSRREFLGGAAGIVAATALPASASAQARGARAAATPVAGATVDLASYGVKSYLDAANIYDGYVGMPLATTMQKVYMGHGQLPDEPPLKMIQLAASGCEFLVSIEPSKTLTTAEQARVQTFLGALTSAGLTYRVALYSEANDKAFKTSQEWFTYWSYYAPVIKAAGATCVYDCGTGFKALPRATAYFPSNPSPDELWMDFYCTSFRGGTRLDNLIGMADAIGIPSGVAEWGWSAGVIVFDPMTMPWWNTYCEYLISLATTGKLTLGAIFFNAVAKGGRADVIGGPSDPRIPGIQRVAQAF